MPVQLRSCDVLGREHCRQQKRARDEGEDDEEAHQHEEILQSGEGGEETSGDAGDGGDGGFENRLSRFLNGRGHPVRCFSLLSYCLLYTSDAADDC